MNKLKDIFKKQEDLFLRFSKIEMDNGIGYGLMKDKPFHINCRFTQAMLKEQAWRITEEVGECIEAYLEKSIADAREEAIDVLHFVVELCIKSNQIIPDLYHGCLESHFNSLPRESFSDEFDYCQRDFILVLAMTMNKLKNKPWKQSHKETNPHDFNKGLFRIYLGSLALCKSLGMDAHDIYAVYMNKAAKNVVRQESGE